MEGGIYPFSSFTYPCPSSSVLDGGWTDLWKQDGLAYPRDPQISKEVYPADLNSLLQFGPMQGTYEGCAEYFESSSPLSTLPLAGHDDVPPATIENPANIGFADVERAYNLRKDDSTPNLTVSSISTETLRKQHAAVPLRPARRLAGMRVVPKRLYSCDICGKNYSQPQGVLRHRQAAHDNSQLCLLCDFKWNRPYQYRIHLEKWHPDVDPDNVLGKSAGSRRRSTIIGRDLPQRSSPPIVNPDRRSRTELRHWQRPVRLLLPTAAKVTHVSRPAMLFVACDHHLERAEAAVTSRGCEEDDHVLELTDATDTPAFWSTGECAQSVNDVGTSNQRASGQLWLPSAWAHPQQPTARPASGCNGTHSPSHSHSNPRVQVGRHYGNLTPTSPTGTGLGPIGDIEPYHTW